MAGPAIVAVVTSRTEAELVVGLLRSHGVDAVSATDDAGGQEPTDNPEQEHDERPRSSDPQRACRLGVDHERVHSASMTASSATRPTRWRGIAAPPSRVTPRRRTS